MSYALIEEKRLEALENGINKILGKLSEPVARVQSSEQEFYTIAQLADKLCWSRSKLSQELRAGNIRSHRKGGRVVILHDELIEDLKR